MPMDPITVQLSDGEKLEALKQFRKRFAQEIARIEEEMRVALRRKAEADFVASYIGEQPEVVEMRQGNVDFEQLNKRRQHLGALLERLDAVINSVDRSKKGPALYQRF